MVHFWKKVAHFVERLDTKEARKSVAADLKKASFTLFGLFLVSIPGNYAVIFQAVANALGVSSHLLKVSTGTLVFLLIGAFLLRVLAFILEIEIKDAAKQTSKTGKKGGHS